MIQALNQKTSDKMKKRKMSNSFHGIRPPQLEQPGAFISQCLDIQLIFIVDDFTSLRAIVLKFEYVQDSPGILTQSVGDGP